MSSLPTFALFALEFAHYKYLLIFIGTIIEGPILMIACGFLLKLGVVEIVPLYISIVAGDLVGDVFWYGIGRYFLDTFLVRFWKYFWVTWETLEKVKILFLKYHTKILFISKITIGFGVAIATLLVAGASRISFKKYMIVNLIGEIILVIALLSIGYILWNAYTQLSGHFKYYFVALFIVVIPLSVYLTHRYLKTKILDQWSHL